MHWARHSERMGLRDEGSLLVVLCERGLPASWLGLHPKPGQEPVRAGKKGRLQGTLS